MSKKLLKITSGTGEQRWINLDRVTRVSFATESAGEPVLVFCFDEQDQVKIHGCDDASRALIEEICASLDSMSGAGCMSQAA